jgi:hypothetical protein
LRKASESLQRMQPVALSCPSAAAGRRRTWLPDTGDDPGRGAFDLALVCEEESEDQSRTTKRGHGLKIKRQIKFCSISKWPSAHVVPK